MLCQAPLTATHPVHDLQLLLTTFLYHFHYSIQHHYHSSQHSVWHCNWCWRHPHYSRLWRSGLLSRLYVCQFCHVCMWWLLLCWARLCCAIYVSVKLWLCASMCLQMCCSRTFCNYFCRVFKVCVCFILGLPVSHVLCVEFSQAGEQKQSRKQVFAGEGGRSVEEQTAE